MASRQQNAVKRLAIVSSHPIQYNAPWFQLLAQSERVRIKVFYTLEQAEAGKNYDKGFGKVIQWDIPLLSGYDYTFVRNISKHPGSNHFKGIINPELNKDIAVWKPDALLVFGWSFQSHLSCLRYFHGKIPVLFRGDSTLLDEKAGIKRMLRRLFLIFVYRHIDYALYTGINNKAYFKVHGIKDSQLVFTPHAIDNKRFADDEQGVLKRAQLWRTELGYSENDIVILYAGKLEPVKDPHLLLDVARMVSNSRLKFLLVGNGEMEKELKDAATGLNNVKFIDFQNQAIMPVVYRLGDAFILPSKSETWGLALNEAMACGRAIIASNKVGAAADLIHPGKNGFIFQSGDAIDLSEKLQAWVEKEDLKEMGCYSKKIVREWSFEHIIGSINKVLNNL